MSSLSLSQLFSLNVGDFLQSQDSSFDAKLTSLVRIERKSFFVSSSSVGFFFAINRLSTSREKFDAYPGKSSSLFFVAGLSRFGIKTRLDETGHFEVST